MDDALFIKSKDIEVILSKDFWTVKVETDLITKTKILRIEGSNTGNPKAPISVKHFLDIIDLGALQNYQAFIFSHIDFNLFRGISFTNHLPVKTVHFEHCQNIGTMVNQIFGNTHLSSKSQNKINSITIFNCSTDFIRLKENMIVFLQHNYQFKSIDFINSDRGVGAGKINDKQNKRINEFLRRNFVYRSICQEVIVILLGIKKFRKGTVLNLNSRDILLIITKRLWEMENKYCHLLAIGEKLNRLPIDKAYHKYHETINHQHSLTIIYDECNPKCLDSLINLKKRRINLNWLVISNTEYHNGVITDIRTSFIPKVFELLLHTKTKILTINNIDFNNELVREQTMETNILNGDDNIIYGIRNEKFPAFQLKELHIVNCSNVRNFLDFFLELFTKIKKTKHGGTTFIRRFNYTKIKLSCFIEHVTYNLSILIDEPSNFIDIKVLK